MSLLYLITVPWLAGLLLFPLRRVRWLVSFLASLAMGATCFICLKLPVDQTLWILGRPLLWDPITRAGLLLVLASMGILFLYGIQTTYDEMFYPLGLAAAGLLVLAVLFRTFVITILLLESIAVLVATLIPTRDPESAPVAIRYLVISILAVPILLLASWFTDQYLLNPDEIFLTQLTVATLVLGFAIIIGGFPFHIWLPPIARSGTSPVTALLMGPINIAIITCFVRILSRYTWLVSNTRIWSIIEVGGMLTAIIGGLFAYTERALGRLWAYSAIADLGFVLMGLSSSSRVGLIGGLFQATVRCIAIILISMSISTIREYCDRDGINDLRGFARRFPMTTLGLTVGGLSLAGMPPTGGFVGHWLVYHGLGDQPIWLLALLLLSSAAVAWGYIRALGSALAQPGPGARSREPLLSSLIIFVVALVLIGTGLYPRPLINVLQSLAWMFPRPSF